MATDDVATHIKRLSSWRNESRRLDELMRDCGLQASIKWGKPCYALGDGNIAITQGFKDTCALMFFKGTLLEDPRGLLEAPGPNSRHGRRMVFTSVADVDAREGDIRAFTAAAIALDKAGARIEKPAHDALGLPPELAGRLKKDRPLATAWKALTPGRQRAWVMHIGAAKQSTTRESRIDKATPSILAGKGLNDR